MSTDAPRIERVDATALRIPTDQPESDATLLWDSTTMVVVTASAGDRTGLGYTYSDAAAATLVQDKLGDAVQGRDPLDVGAAWSAMVAAVRNLGRPGIASSAIAAVDIALWDLKARLLDIPLVVALDAVRDTVPIYGSGGFTSYSDAELQAQLAGWVDDAIPRVKMKVGRLQRDDRRRVQAARDAIGPDTELFVDGNGAYSRKQALAWAEWYAGQGVTWFEEPVSSDDLEGLRLLRDRGPGGLDIAAGEYGYDAVYFQRMLDAGAVDCLQVDVTRAGGISGFLRAAALCDARSIDVSAHTAPQVSTHACAAVWHLRHLEYFHDHVRIEARLFDGVLQPQAGGVLQPDRSRPGHGLELKDSEMERWRVA